MHFILHIGTPKTGTTSIQSFLSANAQWLSSHGIAHVGVMNYRELYYAACDLGRDQVFSSPVRKPVRPRVEGYIASAAKDAHNAKAVIISAETLSYLRTETEIERLRKLFPAESTFTVIVSLRDKADFWRSFVLQLIRQGVKVGSDYWEHFQIGRDSWLTDYDGLLAAYRGLTDDIRVIDYDEVAKDGGNVVGAFLGVLDVPVKRDMALPRMNVTA